MIIPSKGLIVSKYATNNDTEERCHRKRIEDVVQVVIPEA